MGVSRLQIGGGAGRAAFIIYHLHSPFMGGVLAGLENAEKLTVRFYVFSKDAFLHSQHANGQIFGEMRNGFAFLTCAMF